MASGAAGGQGANGEIVVTYTPVYCGNVTWSASGGGSWGTLTSNFGTNWGGAGYGSPGLDPSFPDTATLGSSVASGTAAVTLDGANPYLAALTFSNSTASYTLASGSGGTLHLNGGTAAAALTDSAGSHAISAPVALDTSAIVTVTNPGDTLAISGPISGSGGLTTSGAGTLVLTASNSYTGGTTISAGTLALGNGGTTGSVVGGITNNATLLLNFSGNQPFANSVSGSGNVVVSGPGTVTLQVPLSPTQTTVNQGQLVVAAGASLSGNLVIGGSGYCTNNGNMSNIGNFTNAGIFAGSAQVSGSFSNCAFGQRADCRRADSLPARRLAAKQRRADPVHRHVDRPGGIRVLRPVYQHAGGSGLIAAQNANLYFDSGLTNQASVAFSYGVSNVTGTVANSPGGTISVNGGAGVTFYGDVAQDGTLAVNAVGSTHSSAVFLGHFQRQRRFYGRRRRVLRGRPSTQRSRRRHLRRQRLPGQLDEHRDAVGRPTAGSDYDEINVTGQLVLAGDLDVELMDGFQPQAGETFQLFNGELSGAFGQVTLPALSNGLSWDTSNLDTTARSASCPNPPLSPSSLPVPSGLSPMAGGEGGLQSWRWLRLMMLRQPCPSRPYAQTQARRRAA